MRREFAVILLFFILGCASSQSDKDSSAGSGADERSTASDELPTMEDNYYDRGHRAYLDNCSRCHGMRSSQVHAWLEQWSFSERRIRSYVRNGSSAMPAFPQA